MIKHIVTTHIPRYLLSLSLVLGASALLGVAPAISTLQGTAHAAVQTRATAGSGDLPRVLAVSATPGRLAPLDRVTFAATVANSGFDAGPYRATLQLVPRDGGPERSVSQSGFQLQHNQRLTLYWEWRVGASLPPGEYAMRVELRDTAQAARPFVAVTATSPLVVARG